MTVPSLVVEHAIRLIALVTVVGIGLTLMRPALARTRLFAWELVLCAAWLMPVLVAVLPEIPVGLFSAFAMPEITIVSGGTGSFALSAPADTTAGAIPAGATASLPALVVILYLSGAGLLLVRLAWGWRLTDRLMRSAREVVDAGLREKARQHAEHLGLRGAPSLLESELVRVPFACGVWRQRVVLPETWRSWDSTTLDSVLVHELAHIARRDLWTLRAAAFYHALTWLNPASWWLKRRLEVLSESASDESVLASGINREAYADVLLRFMASGQRTPGRAAWHLAMARPGAAGAEQRIVQVLEWKGGADMALTFAKKLAIAAGIVAVGIPVVVLTAGQKASPTIVKAPVVRSDQGSMKVSAPTAPKVQAAQAVALPEVQEPYDATAAGIVPPIVTRQSHPKYTADAMRAKIQGQVELKVVVENDGTIGDVKVTKSLDTEYGLDLQAEQAIREWRFIPGTLNGNPVATSVVIILEFRLH